MLPFSAGTDDDLEIVIVDLGLARAFWEGVSVARLLARIRLQRDEHDLVEEIDRASGAELDASWDVILARLLAAAPASLERMKRAVARHARAASDEGPLAASDHAVAALVHALLRGEPDASAAECVAVAAPVECALLDARVGTPTGAFAAAFEACLELAKVAAAPVATLAGLTASSAALYPWFDGEIPFSDRRAVLLEPGTIPAELRAKRGAPVLFATPPDPHRSSFPSLPPSSWMPADADAVMNANALAAALERGSLTAPRARALLASGGDAARDAIGKEMLEVAAHPFASAVFAEILAPLARERDVVRLVSYFAIAPDPSAAAHALDLCGGRDVVSTVLRTWLESMLPTDGAIAEPDTSARVASCVAALRPYPALYQAVRPLLRRLSEAPPGL